MTPARHHAEWLSLVESSGPFLSMPVLLRVFPQGLDHRDPERAAVLRENYEDWLERGQSLLHVHTAWIRHVLESLLEWPGDFLAEGQSMPAGLEASQPHFGETLRPDLVLRRPPGGDGDSAPQLLVATYPASQDLEKPVAGKVWKASPATRTVELLHASGVPVGLVTNGEHWMVVSAPRGETSGFASWYADLWMQEPLTLRSFHSLLHLRRFFGVAPEDTLAALFAESSKDQQEVTDQLGRQVRRAVEMLIQAFDAIDQDSGRTLLADTPEKEIYDAALTVMMRLVFLFSAEERGLLLLGDALYDQHYAVSTLREILRERADQHGEEVLERRHDAWSRLLATFRVVHGGVHHESMRLPAYGGSLFDPDRYPFLEGRDQDTSWHDTPSRPLPVNNRVVLHLLEALQLLRVRVPGGGPAEARRLSFRALDIEQIGHVYEGLLDHTARRAGGTVLGLEGKKEPEIPLSKLEELAGIVPQVEEDVPLSDERKVAENPDDPVVPFPTREVRYDEAPAALVAFLKEETGRTPKAIEKCLNSQVDDHALFLACGQDPRLARRVRPFAGLLRSDDFGRLIVIHEGSVFVTAGADRRSSGTHYTPRSLTEPIVKHTLDPLVYTGPAEGLPESEWKLKSPKEILALKVCDLAMGSGAFLVQACRYLAERLCEAWELAEKDHAGQILVTPDGQFSTGATAERLLPADPAERVALARRYVADRCLYGVDINPMAVEMAKLSLWLITVDRGRPFTFLDHALKCGDSLLGISDTHQLERFSLREADEAQPLLETANLWRHIHEAAELRRRLEATPSHTAAQLEEKARLHGEAETLLAKLRAASDFLLAAEIGCPSDRGWETRRAIAASQMQAAWREDLPEFERLAHAELRGRRTFHWPLEYPEIFEAEENSGHHPGFDAFVGNPPFLGGARISGANGDDYLCHLLTAYPDTSGNGDLVSFFLRRSASLSGSGGALGFITTNSIAQGETRKNGLAYLRLQNQTIFRAVKSRTWPGGANVFISEFSIAKGEWKGAIELNGDSVAGISSYLDPEETAFEPYRLSSTRGVVFRGSTLSGEGFVLSEDERATLLADDPLSAEVIKPFLTGQDINQDPCQSSTRYAIDFGAMNEHEARRYLACWQRLYDTVRTQRADNKIASRARLWWQYIGRQDQLYNTIRGFPRVLGCGQVSKYWGVAWLAPGHVYADKVVVFALQSSGAFAVLNSCFHTEWAEKTSSRLKEDPNYNLAKTFETFPFPAELGGLESIGERYHEHRRQLMQTRGEGLTKTHNRLHAPGDTKESIAELRALHRQLDVAVAAAYGWDDLAANDGTALGHDFHETKQGIRFTISPAARREVLDRLLALNHERYAEEVAAGLHDKRRKKRKAPAKRPPAKRGAKPKVPASPAPELPTDFRFPAPDPALYAVNLISALLSARPQGLAWRVLRDAFVAATTPDLMRRLALPGDQGRVSDWAGRWNERASPSLLIPALNSMTSANLAVEGTGIEATFSLQDGPQEPATEDVGYDAWLALHVVEPLSAPAFPEDESTALDTEITALLASL